MCEKQHQPVVSRLLEAGRLLNRKMAESGECSPVCGGKGWVEKKETVVMLGLLTEERVSQVSSLSFP